MSDKLNHAQLPLFIVVFKDGERFVGRTSYFDTGWLDLPLKPIKRIFYKLPNSMDYICLEGYESFFHMIEATKDWVRIGAGKVEKLNNKPIIEYAYIMGKRGNKVVSYRIVLSQKRSRVITLLLDNGKETKEINCGLKAKFYRKDRWIGANYLKVKDQISIYNYDKKELDNFKVIDIKKRVQMDKYKVGDVTIRSFDINDEQIKKLNPNNWR